MTILARWLRYLSHYPASRIVGRVVQEAKVTALNTHPVQATCIPDIGELDWGSIHRFGNKYALLGSNCDEAKMIESGTFVARHYRHKFGSSIEDFSWTYPPDLDLRYLNWWHDLAFFNYAPRLVSDLGAELGGALVESLLLSLESQVPPKGNLRSFAWSPIALAVRSMALISTLSALEKRDSGSPYLAAILRHLETNVGLLQHTIERYLGYNHRAFGAAALLTVSHISGFRSRQRYEREVLKIWRQHLLDDGYWEERSPTYHSHMLLIAWCLSVLDPDTSFGRAMDVIVGNMRDALVCTVHTDDEIALFNDSAIGDAVAPQALGVYRSGRDQLQILPQAGYARISRGNTSAIFDAGRMGPDDVIGHAHADFLSVEVCWQGERLFVDPGVASISSGPLRDYTRSASSHNGPQILGVSPVEFFGAWRVGRRASATLASSLDGKLVGYCDGYRPWNYRVQRVIDLPREDLLQIVDEWQMMEPSVALRASPSAASCFLVPSSWTLQFNSPDRMVFMRETNRNSVTLRATEGELKIMGHRDWFPHGPSVAHRAWDVRALPTECSTRGDLRVVLEVSGGGADA